MSDRLRRSASRPRSTCRPCASCARSPSTARSPRPPTSLGYSQPAVSQQLRRFEERTGIALVERVGRRHPSDRVGPRARPARQRRGDRARGGGGRARRDPGPARRAGAARRLPLGVGDPGAAPHRRTRLTRTRASTSRTSRPSRPRPSRPCGPTVPTSRSRSAIRATATIRIGRVRAASRCGRSERSRCGSCFRRGIRPRADDVVDLERLGGRPWIAGMPALPRAPARTGRHRGLRAARSRSRPTTSSPSRAWSRRDSGWRCCRPWRSRRRRGIPGSSCGPTARADVRSLHLSPRGAPNGPAVAADRRARAVADAEAPREAARRPRRSIAWGDV